MIQALLKYCAQALVDRYVNIQHRYSSQKTLKSRYSDREENQTGKKRKDKAANSKKESSSRIDDK